MADAPGTSAGDGLGIGRLMTYSQGYVIKAYRWGPSEFTELESFTGASAYAVNQNGTTVGTAAGHAVRWERDGFAATLLDNLGERKGGEKRGHYSFLRVMSPFLLA